MSMGTPAIIGWIFLALVAIAGVVTYNRLVRLRNAIANAFAQIDLQLKRRYDLIPNLVETARKYLQHERETLEAVTSARNQAFAAAGLARRSPTAAAPVAALDAAEGVLGGALGRLMAVVEAYPELKADQNMRELSEELTSTENRVGFARQAYNDTVLDFNNGAGQFPANLVAGLFGFAPAAMLQSTQSAQERQAPQVRF
jgi:LemA protein